MARIWDPFLTEQDRKHVEAFPGRQERGVGDRPVLLMLDNYRAAFGDEPQELIESSRSWPMSTGLAGWKALEPIGRVLASARAASMPVVHISALHERDSGLRGWYRPPESTSSVASELDRAAASREARKFDFIEPLTPVAGEAVFRKAAPSAFTQTPLLAHLHELRADTIILCGETTSGCVRATAVDGAGHHRFNMIIPEDCVYDRHQAAHAINLFDMWRKYADVVPADRVIASIS